MGDQLRGAPRIIGIAAQDGGGSQFREKRFHLSGFRGDYSIDNGKRGHQFRARSQGK